MEQTVNSSLEPTQNQLITRIAPTTNLKPPNAVPQQLTTSSATGNPRNKCALEPGHSLMDWIRLGNSGIDLSGTRGRVITVSGNELAKHNKRNDAWLAIRGKVFNVTRYMDFHPGGADELMRGVGTDATKLFEEVHAWINYQQLLSKCYIGPLQNIVKIDKEVLQALQTKTKADETFSMTQITASLVPDMTKVMPRFDWIQRRADITFFIYTRQFCNPGFILTRKDSKEFTLRIQIEHIFHQFNVQLHESVNWPPKTATISAETGKIEINFLKTNSDEIWTNYGSHTTTKLLQSVVGDILYDFEIAKRKILNLDSFEIEMEAAHDLSPIIMTPIGFHVTISAAINGSTVARNYTPVNTKYLNKITADVAETKFSINFLIKNYSTGLLSNYICERTKVGTILQLSQPKGNFKLYKLIKHRQIALLAAGSGLTPFLNLIEHLLKRDNNRIDYLQLLYFNKTAADIWCIETLNALQSMDERFRFTNVLSQADDKWRGLSGRITEELLTPLANKNSTEFVTFVAICGPNAFNQHACEILKNLNFNLDNVHVFQ